MIRKMTLNDLDQVLLIENESFKSVYKKEQYEYELEDNPCAELYVLEYKGRVVAFIDYWITFDSCQLTKLAVLVSEREKGFACELMNFMIDDAIKKGCEAILLEVRKSNVIAQSLYKSYDFFEFNVRKNYYSDNNEDALVMGKAIGGL